MKDLYSQTLKSQLLESKDIKTYGDLKSLVKDVKNSKTIDQVGGVIGKSALSVIPGADAAMSFIDLIKAIYKAPDSKKTGTWLDKINIDDEVSKIVDDTVEDGFIKFFSKYLEGKKDEEPLSSDFNVNVELQNYLATNYEKRTVTGIKESSIEGQEGEVAPKYTSAVKSLDKVQQSNSMFISATSQIKSVKDFSGAFEIWFKELGLDPKKISKTSLKSEVDKVLTSIGYK